METRRGLVGSRPLFVRHADEITSKKREIRQIEAIAREFGMDSDERREFGDYIEDCKRNGEKGSGTDGDFTYGELRDKVPEFRGANHGDSSD